MAGASVLLKLLLTARVLLANPSPVRHQPGGELGLIRFEHIIVHHYPVLKTDDSPGAEMPPPPFPLGTPTTLTAEVREAKTARLTALRREVRQLETELEASTEGKASTTKDQNHIKIPTIYIYIYIYSN